MSSEFQSLHRRIEDAEQSEKRLQEELAAYKADREKRLSDFQRVQERDKESSKSKIQEVEHKMREIEAKRNELLFQLETERAKHGMERENLEN